MGDRRRRGAPHAVGEHLVPDGRKQRVVRAQLGGVHVIHCTDETFSVTVLHVSSSLTEVIPRSVWHGWGDPARAHPLSGPAWRFLRAELGLRGVGPGEARRRSRWRTLRWRRRGWVTRALGLRLDRRWPMWSGRITFIWKGTGASSTPAARAIRTCTGCAPVTGPTPLTAWSCRVVLARSRPC